MRTGGETMFSKYNQSQLSVASKRLNSSFPYIKNSLFEVETFWLRFAFGKNTTWNFREHYHSFYELHIVTSGKATYRINSKTITLTKNTFLFIPPNISHQVVSVSDDYTKFAFSFELHNNDEIIGLLKNEISTCFFDNTPKIVSALVENILENILHEKIGYHTVIENDLINLLLSVMQKMLEFYTPVERSETSANSLLTLRVKMALSYIDDNIADVNAVNIANHLHISTKQLSRTLKTALSMTTQELIVNRRIKKAKKLIQNLDIPLSEIAAMSGFNSQQHFSKTFKRLEGTTATYYRQQIFE